MPDRLENGDSDVTRFRLDRVDDRLDALPDDHRLDLDHGSSFVQTHKKGPGASATEASSPARAALVDGTYDEGSAAFGRLRAGRRG
jgi:hypothetical protein